MNNCDNYYIEEYKTLRQEILEMFNRRTNLTIYTVLATATIFGFSVEFPSAYIFLLPLIIIIPLFYETLALDREINSIGEYIFAVIESKLKGLQWETYIRARKWKKHLEEHNKQKEDRFATLRNIKRQMVSCLLFDILGAICVIFSFWQVIPISSNVSNLSSDFGTQIIDFLKENWLLVFLWGISIIFLGLLTIKMIEARGPKNPSEIEKKIIDIIKWYEKESNACKLIPD